METSVVIPAFKAQNILPKTLDHILKQTYKFSEIIVVINGESIHSYSHILEKYSDVIFLQDDEANRSKARNTGVKKASGKYVVFLDADTLVEENWNRQLMSRVKEFPYIDGFSTKIIPAGHKKTFLNNYRYAYRSWVSNNTFVSMVKPIKDNVLKYQYAPVINTAACLYKKKTIEFFKGFDESIYRGEDEEFSRRLYFKGAWLGTCDESISYVYNDESPLGLFKYLFRYIEIGNASAILSLKLGASFPKLSLSMFWRLYNHSRSFLVCAYHLFSQLIYIFSFFMKRMFLKKIEESEKFSLKTKFAQFKAIEHSKNGMMLSPFVRIMVVFNQIRIETPTHKKTLIFSGEDFLVFHDFLRVGNITESLKTKLIRDQVLMEKLR